MAGDPDPAGAGGRVLDLVEGRDYTVTRRPVAAGPPRAIARKVARLRKPAGIKIGKMRFMTRDPAAMVAVGLAALALEWFLRSSVDK